MGRTVTTSPKPLPPIEDGKRQKFPETINIMTGEKMVDGLTYHHTPDVAVTRSPATRPPTIDIQTGKPIKEPYEFIPAGKYLESIDHVRPSTPLFTRDGRAVPAPLQIIPVIKDSNAPPPAAPPVPDKDAIYNELAKQYYTSVKNPDPAYLKVLAEDIYGKPAAPVASTRGSSVKIMR